MPEPTVPLPTVAILGASRNPAKFGYRSVAAHLRAGYRVYPVNPHAETVAGVPAFATLADIPVDRLDRVSVYLPPETALALLPEIAAKQPREVWFNPGSESPRLLDAAERLGLPVITACSIIDAGLRDPSRS